MSRIVIDPGHGGREPVGQSTPFGARGSNETYEKDVNLELARRVVSFLGPDAALTRSRDENLSLHARASQAARLGARAFISIHANEGPSGSRGSEVWIHDRAGVESEKLGNALREVLAGCTPGYGAGPTPVSRGPMAVLAPEVLGALPACLIEADYLSDPAGEARLRDPASLDTLGAAIAAGVRRYLGAGAIAAAQAQSLAQTPAQAMEVAIPNQPPTNPQSFRFLSGGTWNHTQTLSISGGQAMWFKIRNINVLGTTLTLRSGNQVASSILLPQQSVDWVFSSFGNEPMGWTFDIRTQSSAFICTWELWSTWVPGMPSNP